MSLTKFKLPRLLDKQEKREEVEDPRYEALPVDEKPKKKRVYKKK